MSEVVFEVCEPVGESTGSISARLGEHGPELVWACGRERGDWYVMVNEVAAQVGGMEERRHIACRREDAEYMVRLIAGIHERAMAGSGR